MSPNYPDAILDTHFVEVLLEFELGDIAELWKGDQAEYYRLAEIGWRQKQRATEPVASVRALVSVYEDEATRCEAASAYYAACTMLGAAAEARLLLKALSDPVATEAARLRLGRQNRSGKSDPRAWTFDHLISVAREAQWIGVIPDDATDYTFIVSGLLHQLRAMRNYVHAGRHGVEKPMEVLTWEELSDARAAYHSLIISLEISGTSPLSE